MPGLSLNPAIMGHWKRTALEGARHVATRLRTGEAVPEHRTLSADFAPCKAGNRGAKEQAPVLNTCPPASCPPVRTTGQAGLWGLTRLQPDG